MAINNDIVDKNTNIDSGQPLQMKIVSVIPIDKGIFKDRLSYFSKSDIPLGSIIKVPVRKKTVPALVVEVKSATEIKTELKSQNFTLKKLTAQDVVSFFVPEFVDAAIDTSNYFICHIGQVIKAVTPKVILENPELFTKTKKIAKKSSGRLTDVKTDVSILQEPDEERLTYYKSLIRESFAKDSSVFLCLPTISDIDKVVPYLEKGIDQYTLILHSKLSKKEMVDSWSKVIKTKHPVLIIATPLFLSVPRSDIGTIILDQENHSAYKTVTRPLIDLRYFAEKLARHKKINMVLGDTVLRTETIVRHGKGELIALSPLKYRSFSEASQKLINLKETGDKDQKGTPLLSSDLKEIIRKTIDNNERLFLYTTRRGTAGMTVCNDCGMIMTCDDCRSPLVIHKNPDKKYEFICHKCGTSYKIKDSCPECGSWRLAMLAEGIQKVEAEIKKDFPDVPIFMIDSDSVKSSKKAQDIVNKFLAKTGHILIGTEMSLYYLNEPVENTAIVSIDSLFSFPDFRISEKIFGTLIRIRELSIKRFLVQTRNPEEKVFNYALKGNLLDFYREEIEERKAFNYPPFSTLIKITRSGSDEAVKKDMEFLAQYLEDYAIRIYPAFTSRVKNKLIMHGLIKIPADKWIDANLLDKLKGLPPVFAISVDPEEIL